MEKKQCTKCKIKKELTEFYKNKSNKDGLCCECKSCQKEYQKVYRKEYHKEYRKKNKEKIKEYRENNKDKSKKYQKVYRKIYYEKNKDKINQKHKEYKEKNIEKIKEYRRKYKKDNKEKRKEYRKNKRRKDHLYKMKCNLRNRTTIAFKNKGYSKNTKTQKMLGVEWEICKAHIERQFTKGMNWDNYGEWHIDHIIPLASANTEKELIKLCHYSNLQPLWAEDNFSKSDKIEFQQTKLRI